MTNAEPKDNKDRLIRFRLSEKELAIIKLEMSKLGQNNISRFARMTLLKKEFIVVHKNNTAEKALTHTRDLLQELNRIGSNLNQITRSIHRTFGYERANKIMDKVQTELSKTNIIAAKCASLIENTRMNDR